MIRFRAVAVIAGLGLAMSLVGTGAANAAIGTGTAHNRSWNLCLDATDDATHSPTSSGDPVQLWGCNNGEQQNWTFNAGTGNWGTVKNAYGLCLDARTDATHNPSTPGDPVQLWSCNGGSQQQWRLYDYFGTGTYFLLTNGAGTHLTLDARQDADWNPGENGDPVQLWSETDQDNQLWSLP